MKAKEVQDSVGALLFVHPRCIGLRCIVMLPLPNPLTQGLGSRPRCPAMHWVGRAPQHDHSLHEGEAFVRQQLHTPAEMQDVLERIVEDEMPQQVDAC
jgi:hypothetical protein